MKTIKSIFLLILLFISSAVLADTLTLSSVGKFIDKVQSSARARDAELLTSYFTPDATITIEMPRNMGGTLKLNKTQYKEILKQGWAMPGKYTYEVRDLEITLAKDQQSATVKDLTVETIEVGGQVVSSKSRETINIIVSDGTPLINSIIGKVEL